MTLRGIFNLIRKRRRVLFLAFFEMFQRFNFYGFQAMMFLFLKHELDLKLHNAIGVYHIYIGLGCLVPLIGTIIADLYMNKVMSIIVISIYAVIGNVLIVVTSATFGEAGLSRDVFLNVGAMMTFGLLFRAMGGGGVREITRSLGNDQFKLPAENRELLDFHQMFHYFMTFGTIMAFIIPPVLRMHTSCFGEVYCFPIAFGVPALFMLFATAAICSGYSVLKNTKPGRSVIIDFTLCIKTALGNRNGGGKHWVDNASHEYNNKFLDEVQATVHVLWLFLTLPTFWALFDLTGSLWVYQASNMLGTVSKADNWYVEPDQMQVIIPIATLILLPILEHFLYPTLEKCKYFLSTPRQRMFFGSFLTVLAFITAVLIEMKIEPTHAPVPHAGECDLFIWNSLDACAVQFATADLENFEPLVAEPEDFNVARRLPVSGVERFVYDITAVKSDAAPDCPIVGDLAVNGTSYLVEGKSLHILVHHKMKKANGSNLWYNDFRLPDDLRLSHAERCVLQLPRVGLIHAIQLEGRKGITREIVNSGYPPSFEFVLTRGSRRSGTVRRSMDPNRYHTDFFHARPYKYSVTSDRPKSKDVKIQISLKRGEVGVILIKWFNGMKYTYKSIVTPLTVSMWWQVPQYVLIAMAEFLFPMTLLEYSHTQVTERMRPVLTSFWLLSIALGNFLVSIITFPHPFNRGLWYYVLFACLMTVDCFLLLILLHNYKPAEENVDEVSEEGGDSVESDF